MSTHKISLKLNGESHTREVESRLLLVHLIREDLNLTGTHIGCDTSSCGACTVLMNGRPVKSCTVFAVQADGAEITTVEGLAQNGNLHPIQEGFMEKHGLQCGFCTPGMMMTSVALLKDNPSPTEEEIRWGISGNLCRCTMYMTTQAPHAIRTVIALVAGPSVSPRRGSGSSLPTSAAGSAARCPSIPATSSPSRPRF